MVYGQGRKPKDPKRKEEEVLKIIDLIVAGLEAGMSVTKASRAAGLNPRTYYQWAEWAKKGKKPWATHWERIEYAQDRGMVVLAGRVMTASKKDWRAAAWMLERRDPKQWGKREHQSVEHSGEVKQQVTVSTMSTAERLARIKELEAKIKEMEGGDKAKAPKQDGGHDDQHSNAAPGHQTDKARQ
jgi:hypothetical protein